MFTPTPTKVHNFPVSEGTSQSVRLWWTGHLQTCRSVSCPVSRDAPRQSPRPPPGARVGLLVRRHPIPPDALPVPAIVSSPEE